MPPAPIDIMHMKLKTSISSSPTSCGSTDIITTPPPSDIPDLHPTGPTDHVSADATISTLSEPEREREATLLEEPIERTNESVP